MKTPKGNELALKRTNHIKTFMTWIENEKVPLSNITDKKINKELV